MILNVDADALPGKGADAFLRKHQSAGTRIGPRTTHGWSVGKRVGGAEGQEVGGEQPGAEVAGRRIQTIVGGIEYGPRGANDSLGIQLIRQTDARAKGLGV